MSAKEVNPDLFGWNREAAEADWPYQAKTDRFVAFASMAEPEDPDYHYAWEYAKRVNGGKHLPTWYQETGDCVSMGATNAIQYAHCHEIARLRQEEKFRFVYPPYIYAQSRTKKDTGNGQLGRGAGSTGAWAIQAVRKYGVLFSDDEGVPKYTGDVADEWGYKGAPVQFEKLAADNPIEKAAKLSTSEQVRAALLSNQMITYAIMWRYGTEAAEHKGYRVLKGVSGRPGGHQVCAIAWMDEPFEAAFILNSWGANVHQGPDHGEPPGGAWLPRSEIDRDLSSEFSEVFALGQFVGEPGSPDHGGL
uniref:Uncharacterized protein n=1 Tax=viral metagenome TaxID=1070528 RepID=A0A6M3JKD1_9ZZZZ